ncbi:tRNA-splicing endonuclease subunit Sen2 isoform X2 [Esox lucius]|uniref:tRNA-splicing endonuclease subunit Sen2 isoform X2 n=1 Tax=Esox lucius TaxID=8010 RepID=UPI0014777B2B|nr:tRNA-splicing endonuclease subunit Sen2 isoform X2 [Esox lucius]
MTEALFQAPKRRARVYELYDAPFPVPLTAEDGRLQRTLIYRAEIVNQHVVVRDPEHVQALYNKGYFGKGILSRSRPDHSVSHMWEKFGEQVLPVISLSKYQKHMSWARDVLLAQGLEEEVVRQTLKWFSQPIEMDLREKNGHNVFPSSPQRREDTGSDKAQDQVSKQAQIDEGKATSRPGNQESDHPQAKRPRRQGDSQFDPLAKLYSQEPRLVHKAALAKVRCSRHDDWLVDCGCRLDDSIVETLQIDSQSDRPGTGRPGTDVEHEYVLVMEEDEENRVIKPARSEPGTKVTGRKVCRVNPFRLLEYLQLTLEEAFFLVYALGCLSVYYNEEPFRGWVPKPGVKYGTDLLLYRKGPPFYHASYSVVVERVDQGLRGEALRPFSWRTLAALSRITGNVSKELMLCYVIYPSEMEEHISSPHCLSRVTVQEIILSRWISSQERTEMDDI